MFKVFAITFTLVYFNVCAYSQINITENELVQMALKNSRNLSASSLAITQQKQLLKGSFNLPNPEVFIESPTGNFYTGSITQSFEFPSVYGKQNRLQKEKVTLAEKEKVLTENDIKFAVRQLYLSLQYEAAVQQKLFLQDTVYEKISKAAARQFEAGQINYLQKIFTETAYGEIHNQYLQSELRYKSLLKQIQYISGYKDSLAIKSLVILNEVTASETIDSTVFTTNASLQIIQQNKLIAQKNISLQKAKALPGFAFGYFNQGERNTPFQNRFRFGITFPLWFAQYKSNINTAKTEFEITKQKEGGLQQQFTVQLLQAQNELSVYKQSVNYYQTIGINKATEIISTARRFFENGENDYIEYLRNINDAYSIQLKYPEAIKNYNQSILNIQYLKGTL